MSEKQGVKEQTGQPLCSKPPSSSSSDPRHNTVSSSPRYTTCSSSGSFCSLSNPCMLLAYSNEPLQSSHADWETLYPFILGLCSIKAAVKIFRDIMMNNRYSFPICQHHSLLLVLIKLSITSVWVTLLIVLMSCIFLVLQYSFQNRYTCAAHTFLQSPEASCLMLSDGMIPTFSFPLPRTFTICLLGQCLVTRQRFPTTTQ